MTKIVALVAAAIALAACAGTASAQTPADRKIAALQKQTAALTKRVTALETQIAQATQAGKVYFGPQAAVNDSQTCSAIRITRQQTVPPSVAAFSALTALLA
jgi:hypothetical protein